MGQLYQVLGQPLPPFLRGGQYIAAIACPFPLPKGDPFSDLHLNPPQRKGGVQLDTQYLPFLKGFGGGEAELIIG